MYKNQSQKLDELISIANERWLEILLEVNTSEELEKASKRDVTIIGINNRNLNTLELDMNTTEKILSEKIMINQPIISESGIFNSKDLQRIGKTRVSGFLIGTSIMGSRDIEGKVRELSTVKKWT